MTKQKACKICRTIYEGESKCPSCESKEFSDNFKGRTLILNAEKSEIAKNLKILKKGEYAIKN